MLLGDSVVVGITRVINDGVAVLIPSAFARNFPLKRRRLPFAISITTPRGSKFNRRPGVVAPLSTTTLPAPPLVTMLPRRMPLTNTVNVVSPTFVSDTVNRRPAPITS